MINYQISNFLIISTMIFISNLNLTQNSTNLKIFLENGILVIIYVIIIIFILMFFRRWIYAKADIVILPFDAPKDIKTFNGKALSDLLIHNLEKIQRIHNTNRDRYFPIVGEKTASINMAAATESLPYTVSSVGTIAIGSVSVSLDQLLVFFKRLFPFTDMSRVISGSLQKLSSSYTIIARMEYTDTRIWVVDGEDDNQISILVKELAFMIIKDLSMDIKAKTWKGLNHFTDALDAFD